MFGALAALPEPNKPLFVTLRASIASDRLAADDERFLAAPVVAALPFEESPGGETDDLIEPGLAPVDPVNDEPSGSRLPTPLPVPPKPPVGLWLVFVSEPSPARLY